MALSWDELVALQRGLDLPDLTAAQFWPDWHDRAACADSDANFFPERGEAAAAAAAVAVCASCPVRPECLAFALGQDASLVGVWGGTTGADRKRMRQGSAA